MREFVYGNDMVISAYKGDDYYPFACVETCQIELNTELLDTSAPGSGAWDDFWPSGRNNWNANMSGVTVLDDAIDTLWYSWELFLQQVRSEGLNLKFNWRDTAGTEKYATGFVWVPQSSLMATSDDLCRWLARFQGSGALDLNGTLITSNSTAVERLDWITTGAEPNKVQDNKLIGKLAADIYEVSLEGDDKFKVITAGAPTEKQVKLDNVTGELIFKIDFDPQQYIFAIIKKVI